MRRRTSRCRGRRAGRRSHGSRTRGHARGQSSVPKEDEKRTSPSKKSRRSAAPVAEHQRPVDAHAEREAGVALAVDAAGGQHPGVDHAAAAPLDPALAAAGAAGVGVDPPADEAAQVDLGGRLGEREVRRPEPGRDARRRTSRAAKWSSEPLRWAMRDALVDDEALDLVEHRAVGRVVLVGAEDPARADDVDRWACGSAWCAPAPARCGCAAPGGGRPARPRRCPAWCGPGGRRRG